MKKFIASLLMLMALCVVAWADAVTFEAAVSSSQVPLDEVLQLTLTVTGANDNLDPVSLPVIDGFTAKYLGPSDSSSYVFVNGKSESHTSRSFIYNLFPNKVGKFEIPAISATIAGHTYATQPIVVEVVSSSSNVQQPSGQVSSQNQAPSLESLKDKIFLAAHVDKKEVYLNEKVPLTIKLLVNDVPVRDIQYPQFEKQGFQTDAFDKPQQSSGIFNGSRYDTVEFKTNIYPNRLGEVTLGPVQLSANLLYKTGSNNPFGSNSGFLGTDVFNSFFDSYASRPIVLTSEPVVLHVLPLPQESRPNDFSGAIGQFDFKVAVSPVQVKAGDPITLKMDITGKGNFKNFQIPVFQAAGFKTYSPQIKDLGNEKTAEEVIIPMSVDVKEVPALRFSYFDIQAKDYKTIVQGPFPIQVAASSPEQEFKAVGFSNLNPAGGVNGNSFSWGKVFHKIFQCAGRIFRSVIFWIGSGLVLAAWVSLIVWRRFQERLKNDPAFARRLKAVSQAKRALIPAGELISKGQTKDFYALISKILRDYLANKWHHSSAALNMDEILSRLKAAECHEARIAELKAILEQADLACFAGAIVDPEKMRTHLAETQDLIVYLERFFR